MAFHDGLEPQHLRCSGYYRHITHGVAAVVFEQREIGPAGRCQCGAIFFAAAVEKLLLDVIPHILHDLIDPRTCSFTQFVQHHHGLVPARTMRNCFCSCNSRAPNHREWSSSSNGVMRMSACGFSEMSRPGWCMTWSTRVTQSLPLAS